MDAVYKITNTVNDKVYIGYSSRGATDRWYQHCANAFKKSKKSKLYSAMRKYGKESFVAETIYEGKDALQKENDFIIKYNSKENGYNMTDGGEANRLGTIWNKEARKRLSEKLKGHKKPPRTLEHCKAISEGNKGRTAWNVGIYQTDVSSHGLYMREYRRNKRESI